MGRFEMMGQQGSGQDRLFYSFNLDEHVPQDHLLRGINQFLDLRDLREHLHKTAVYCLYKSNQTQKKQSQYQLEFITVAHLPRRLSSKIEFFNRIGRKRSSSRRQTR
jgi:hypothetical protein